MGGKIFISYRRDDAAGDARSIYDALAGRFERANVFMDVDNLLAGQRFDKELSAALDACDVLIAVVGQRWMDLLAARTESSDRDYVREEIAAALRRSMIVIPVRVGLEGRMPPLPRGNDLPEDIRDLVLHQKHDVAHETFGRDVRDLIDAIEATRKRTAEDDPNHNFVPQREPPFSFPHTAPPQQPGSAGRPSGRQADLHGYDLGNYMSARGQQEYAQLHHANIRPQQQEPTAFAAPQGYDETDGEFDELMAKEEGPSRGRVGLTVVAALIGAIGLGGSMAYTYKTFFPSHVRRPPLVKPADDGGPSRDNTVRPAGEGTVQNDKKLVNRLVEDNAEQKVEKAQDRVGNDPNAPRKVRVVPITTGDTATRPGGSSAPLIAVPGVTLEKAGPPAAAPALAASSGAGFVAVLSSQKTRMDALKIFANMQEKYSDVLSSRTPDLQEVNLGEKGVWYRLVVGPSGSRDAAAGLCTQLKTAGFAGCWVTAY